MKIIKLYHKQVDFEELEIGDFFVDQDERLYVTIPTVYRYDGWGEETHYYNALYFNETDEGEIVEPVYLKNVLVFPVEVELIVKN